MPEDGAASGLQHAFPSVTTIGLTAIKEFDFSQSSKDGVVDSADAETSSERRNVEQDLAAETSETTSVETPTLLPTSVPLMASAGKAQGATCCSGQLELPRAKHEDEQTSQLLDADDSDSCDFNE